MAHEGYHEPYEKLSEAMRSKHRAIISVVEELEAIDWYYQRADVTEDASLKAILLPQRARGDRARDDGARVDPP